MKTSCSSWSYHRIIKAGKMDQMSCLEECAAIGLDGVELLSPHFPSRDKDYLLALRKKCADLFLSISMVSALGHLTVADDAKREQEVKEIGEWVKVAQFLGAPCLRFFCGDGQELAAGGPQLYAKVLASMKQVAAMGAECGMIMALENHGNTDADQILSFQRDVNSPFLRLTLDTGNFPPAGQVGPKTYSSIERCAPLAAIVHAKFMNVKADGSEADFDWLKIRGILAKAGFRGFLSVEYEGKDNDEVAVMRRVAKFLTKLCQE
jgi:L-ribulose-5-phosphate 3-epimerase